MKNSMLNIIETLVYYDRPIAGIAKVFDSRYVFFILIDINPKDVFGYIYLTEDLLYQFLTRKIGVRDLILSNIVFRGYWDEGQWTHIQPTEEQLPTENWFYLDDDDKEFPCLG